MRAASRGGSTSTAQWGQGLVPQAQDIGIAWHMEHNRPCFYVRAPGMDGVIDVLGASRRPFSIVPDLDRVVSFG